MRIITRRDPLSATVARAYPARVRVPEYSVQVRRVGRVTYGRGATLRQAFADAGLSADIIARLLDRAGVA